MARKIEDLTGKRFGTLTVVSYNEEVSKKKKGVHWNCICDCGNEKVIWGTDLKRGHTTNCGCIRKEKAIAATKEKWEKDKEYAQKMSNGLKEKWEDKEFREKHSGKHNVKWQGGITPIKRYFSESTYVQKWKQNTYTRENNTCQITGLKMSEEELNVHHLYSFSLIFKEAHDINNIKIKKMVCDYTDEELEKLNNYIESWHKDTSNAVLISENIHKLFHSVYGCKNNTPEQFEEFKERYFKGEFNN